jgi:hypothetical protein
MVRKIQNFLKRGVKNLIIVVIRKRLPVRNYEPATVFFLQNYLTNFGPSTNPLSRTEKAAICERAGGAGALACPHLCRDGAHRNGYAPLVSGTAAVAAARCPPAWPPPCCRHDINICLKLGENN